MGPRAHSDWVAEHAVAGLLVMIFGVMAVVAFQYPEDARLFPLIIGTAGLILSTGVLLQAMIQHRSEKKTAKDPMDKGSTKPARQDTPLRSLIALASAPAYGILLWLAGFYMASGMAFIALPYGLGYRKPGRLLILMVVSVVLMRILFANVMGIQMPQGLLGEWFLETFIYED